MLISAELLILSTALVASAYKIGIFVSDMSTSQVIWNARVGEALADAGHNVTLIRIQKIALRMTPLKIRNDLEVWSYDARREENYEELNDLMTNLFEDLPVWSSNFQKVFKTLGSSMSSACEVLLQNKEFLNRLRSAHFDLIFADMAGLCSTGLVHYAGVPAWIFMHNAPLMDALANIIGVSSPASYVPPIMSAMNDELSFFDRTKSLLTWAVFPFFFKRMLGDPETEMFRKYIDPSFPYLPDLIRDCPIIMVNSEEMYMLPRPTLHKIVNVAGLGMKAQQAKPLEAEFSKIAEKASNMVVFSLGSVVNSSSMPIPWKKALMDSFRKFPDVEFIMRYEIADLESIKPPNVHTFKWIPQTDLMHHVKTRALMSHGGVNSVQEAINSGKPIVAIPLIADQSANAKVAEKRGFAVILNKSNFSVDSITDALNTVLHNHRYAESAERLRQMIQKKPFKAEERLVRWTEFVAEFHTLPNLIPYGVHLSFVEYFCLDVIGFLFLCLTAVIVTVCLLLRCCCRVVRSKIYGPASKQKTA